MMHLLRSPIFGAIILWMIFVYRESMVDPEWRHNRRLYKAGKHRFDIPLAAWLRL
jgi:hypothetical protein